MKRKSKLRFAIGHRDDAGIDITNKKRITIFGNSCECIDTGITNLNLKRGYCGFICLRSRYSDKPLLVQSPCIDAGYTGEIHIWVRNLSGLEFTLLPDVSYFQLYVVKIRPWRKNEVVVENKHPRGNTRCTTR